MSTTQIDEIIEYLTNNGLAPEDVENDDDYTSLEYDSFWVDIDCSDSKIEVVFTTALAYKFTFGKGCANFLNSFATDWEIYKGYLKIVFNVRNAQELATTVKKCAEKFKER